MKRGRGGSLATCTDSTNRTYFRAWIYLESGERVRVNLTDDVRFDRVKSRRQAAQIQAREDVEHGIAKARAAKLAAKSGHVRPSEGGETADEWYARFAESRTVAGAQSDHNHWRKWCSADLGPLPVANITSDDIEKVRDRLDAAMANGQIMPKTGANLWAVVTTAMKHATQSKDRSLRVLKVNPCFGVMPPETGDSRTRPWLFPNEMAKLLACEAVPVEFRRLYAVASYLAPRPGELAELRFSDLDFDARSVSISRAFDWKKDTVKPPKTRNGIRRVPMPETLVPLLEAMMGEPGDLLFPAYREFGETRAAGIFREHLALAGIDRPRLLESSATFMPVDFRSLRGTGLTWWALAGVPVATISRRAGHDDANTSMGYVREVEDLEGANFGTPFGPLPDHLTDQNPPKTPFTAGKPVPRAGVEPARFLVGGF